MDLEVAFGGTVWGSRCEAAFPGADGWYSREFYAKWREDTMAVQISDDCIGCSACVNECPQGAIEIQDGQAVVDEATCVKCGICVDACPASAITL